MDWTKKIMALASRIPKTHEGESRHDAFVDFETLYDALPKDSPERQAFVMALGEIIDQNENAHVVAQCIFLAAAKNFRQLRPTIENLGRSQRFTNDQEARQNVLHAVSAYTSLSALDGHTREKK